ncbi:MAG: hypothetical protein GY861_19385 [bacterium]|nr:hypothetical protein [bacterium]
MQHRRRHRHPRESKIDRFKAFLLIPKVKRLFIILSIIIFIILFKKIVTLLLLGAVVMLVDYLLHRTHFPIHIDLLFFATLLITHSYGLGAAIIFCIITGTVPELLAGNIDISDMLSIIPIILLCAVSLSFTAWGIVTIGIVFSIVFAITDFVVHLLLGEPPHKMFIEPIAVLILNIILFMRFGELLISLMQ